MNIMHETGAPLMGERPIERNPSAYPLLLIGFPGAVALAGSPSLVLLVSLACLFAAFYFGCLKAFVLTLLTAFALNFWVVSGFAVYSDVDAYLGPAIRLFGLGIDRVADGLYHQAHLLLPQGFIAWSAALYRLTGWLDAGNALIFMLIPGAWCVLRTLFSRLQTFLLVVAPLTFTSIFCSMPDGCVYLLLLMALVELRVGSFWVPLLAMALACTFKTTAWIPSLLMTLVLLRNQPRNALKVIGVFGFVAVCVLPTLMMLARGGVEMLSADFREMNEVARAMGYWARLAYAYVGHWTVAGTPTFNVPMGGIDGGGMDGLGPVFRVLLVCALGILLLRRTAFRGWWESLIIIFGSVLAVPTLYIGYARYVPLLYLAGMLPLVIKYPRCALVPWVLLCAMPCAWMGWRILLATETITVQAHASAVQSDLYNVRAAFRSQLTEIVQPTLSGSLAYTYAGTHFPAVPRAQGVNHRLMPATEKARGMVSYIVTTWAPWALQHFPELIYETAVYRIKQLMHFPRGAGDGIPSATR